MDYKDLPENVREICESLICGLKEILGNKMYGVYMYGAAVFPDSGPVTDIDCHVILKYTLNDAERSEISRLYKGLAELYPPPGDEPDIWYILYDDARKSSLPRNQLEPDMYDESWPLHCAHIRAGMYIALDGPKPVDVFPAPSREDITAALEHELDYVRNNLQYPAYCILNLCRIIYSFRERNVVISKRFSGIWAIKLYPQWISLIEAAIRAYEGTATRDDDRLLKAGIESFLAFAVERINEIRMSRDTKL